MRTVMKWAVALLVVAVCGTTALPGEADVPEGTVVKLLLLRQKSVQKELSHDPTSTIGAGVPRHRGAGG